MLRLNFLSLVYKIFLTMPGPNAPAQPRSIRIADGMYVDMHSEAETRVGYISTVGVLNEVIKRQTWSVFCGAPFWRSRNALGD